MQQRGYQQKARLSMSVAVIGLFSAIYILVGGVLGVVIGPFLRGYPAHFLRGWLMSSSAAYSGRMWSASLLGLISGLVFLVVVPAPAPYLPLATLAAGVTYDLALSPVTKYSSNALSSRRIILATSISSVAESITALAVLTYIGLFTDNPIILAIIWTAAILANITLACVGSLITIFSIRKKILLSRLY